MLIEFTRKDCIKIITSITTIGEKSIPMLLIGISWRTRYRTGSVILLRNWTMGL